MSKQVNTLTPNALVRIKPGARHAGETGRYMGPDRHGHAVVDVCGEIEYYSYSYLGEVSNNGSD